MISKSVIGGITLCLIVVCFTVLAHAQEFRLADDPAYYNIGINKPNLIHGLSGYYSIGTDNVQNKGQNSTALSQYLNIGMRGIGLPLLSFYGYGRLNTAINNEESYGDLYLGYIQYKTFQGITNVMLGRFAQVTNRFMTIDGVSAAQILPWNFGVTAYVGMPRYKEMEEYDEELRDLGDLSYGGKVFLSGIPSLQANISYYKETGNNNDGRLAIYRETLGGGVLYYKTMSAEDNTSITADVHMEQDVYNGNLARLSGKLTGHFSRVQGTLFSDYYDIRDQYPEGRPFVIRLLSTGFERRYGADMYVKAASWMDLYGGVTYTKILMRGHEENAGQIYTLGTDLSFDTQGLRATLEGYDYESVISSASGIMGKVQWYITMDMFLQVSGETAWLRKTNNDNNAVSLEGRYTIYLLNNLTTSLYGQAGSNNRFVDDYRWGAAIKYEFR